MAKALILPCNIAGFAVQYLPFCGTITVLLARKTAIFLLKLILFSQKFAKNRSKIRCRECNKKFR